MAKSTEGWTERSRTVDGKKTASWRERPKPGQPGTVERVYTESPLLTWVDRIAAPSTSNTDNLSFAVPGAAEEKQMANYSENELRDMIAELEREAAGKAFTPAQQDQWNHLNIEMESFINRRARLMQIQTNAGNSEREVINLKETARAQVFGTGRPVPRHLDESRSAALRALERNVDAFSAEAQKVLEEYVERDVAGAAGGVDSRYIAAAGDPDYRTAFAKVVADPMTAHLKMTSSEQAALSRANEALVERALSEGTTTAGGFAIPIAHDPSVILTSSGALNPIRQVADVRTLTTHELRLVTSDGVTASFSAEATEVADNSPVLAQPILYAEKAQAFVPFSIELGQDWNSLLTELTTLMVDAKDVLESSKFLSGLGHASYEPQGLLLGSAATAVYTSASTATLAIADVYGVLEAIPARFQKNTSWLSSPTTLDRIYRLAGGGSTEPQLMYDRAGGVLGRKTYEWSDMSTSTASGSTVAAIGDIFAGFAIGDRIGATAELIPHLFATANNRPSGQRGLYFHFRTGSIVKTPLAYRALKIL